jgi:signal transduction histidine kinase
VSSSARADANAVRIDGIDNGVGIAAADRARVHEFVQLGGVPRHHASGRHGLGLAIVRDLPGSPPHDRDGFSAAARASITVPRAMRAESFLHPLPASGNFRKRFGDEDRRRR